MTNTSTERTAGYETACREIADDGWTAETARRYLATIGATETDPAYESEYGRGFNLRLRELAASS